MSALAPLDRAIVDYAGGSVDAALVVHGEGSEAERLRVAHFFRSLEELSEAREDGAGPLQWTGARCRSVCRGACVGSSKAADTP